MPYKENDTQKKSAFLNLTAELKSTLSQSSTARYDCFKGMYSDAYEKEDHLPEFISRLAEWWQLNHSIIHVKNSFDDRLKNIFMDFIQDVGGYLIERKCILNDLKIKFEELSNKYNGLKKKKKLLKNNYEAQIELIVRTWESKSSVLESKLVNLENSHQQEIEKINQELLTAQEALQAIITKYEGRQEEGNNRKSNTKRGSVTKQNKHYQTSQVTIINSPNTTFHQSGIFRHCEIFQNCDISIPNVQEVTFYGNRTVIRNGCIPTRPTISAEKVVTTEKTHEKTAEPPIETLSQNPQPKASQLIMKYSPLYKKSESILETNWSYEELKSLFSNNRVCIDLWNERVASLRQFEQGDSLSKLELENLKKYFSLWLKEFDKMYALSTALRKKTQDFIKLALQILVEGKPLEEKISEIRSTPSMG